ncbi:very-long-chain (3R)-3-hydroxyacyl-CoA dehydratase 2 [Agrilus planipennis]|uniref:Very-long-chain (3R)-3-hydroxyacyl-CoA dehydratase n=1 Tax=Agrilus planipennis TaxID=224129 RepID=A0A1W4WSE6_AGRPL|nr:very-long-chain (3R)-3-hydroxyacyl-CoA dehydratase 2 [Agrilus planipennis]
MTGSAIKQKRETSGFSKAYLIVYNVVQTLGWSYLLFQVVTYYVSLKSANSLYETVKWTVIIFQNAAVLEIVHAFLKLVPSNPIVTLQQVFSRVMLVCGVLMVTNEGRDYFGLPLALFAWCITEIIRYGFYALNLIGFVPDLMKWLRYTTFIILYPVGVTGELLCLYGAFREVSRNRLWSVDLPNFINFSFQYDYFIMLVMLLYIPLFPQLYLHMFTLRRKVLGGVNKFPENKTK